MAHKWWHRIFPRCPTEGRSPSPFPLRPPSPASVQDVTADDLVPGCPQFPPRCPLALAHTVGWFGWENQARGGCYEPGEGGRPSAGSAAPAGLGAMGPGKLASLPPCPPAVVCEEWLWPSLHLPTLTRVGACCPGWLCPPPARPLLHILCRSHGQLPGLRLQFWGGASQ